MTILEIIVLIIKSLTKQVNSIETLQLIIFSVHIMEISYKILVLHINGNNNL